MRLFKSSLQVWKNWQIRIIFKNGEKSVSKCSWLLFMSSLIKHSLKSIFLLVIKAIQIISCYHPTSLSISEILWIYWIVLIFTQKALTYNQTFCQNMLEICLNYLFYKQFIQINQNSQRYISNS